MDTRTSNFVIHVGDDDPGIPQTVRDGFPVQEIEVKYMKQIFKDVLSCKSLRDGLKQAILAIVVAILERTIIALKGGTNNVRYIDV